MNKQITAVLSMNIKKMDIHKDKKITLPVIPVL